MASRVETLATKSELPTVTASPSLKSTKKLSNWIEAGNQVGGEEKISSGVLKEMEKSQ